MNLIRTTAIGVVAMAAGTLADTHYVNVNNGSPVLPYTNWSTAAQQIQQAVDAATDSDTVLVTNGVCDTGGGVTPGYSCNNRVVITQDIFVCSVNGPAGTIILGAPDPIIGTTGSNAVRCVYMSAGTLVGFTITNGYTMSSGDFWYDQSGGGVNMYGGNGVVSNCTICGNSAGSEGGGTSWGTVNNCTICDNSANDSGGGTFYGTVNNCTIRGNSAGYGGGSCGSSLNNCLIINNTATGGVAIPSCGGGTDWSTVNNCTILSNSAFNGGGTSYGTVNNCTIISNTATCFGGGAYRGTVSNCTIYGNHATCGGGTQNGTVNNCTICGNSAGSGGGTHIGTVNNCMICGNSADHYGGGTCYGTLNNCTVAANSTTNCCGGTFGSTVRNTIVWDNQAAIRDDNYSNSIFEYSCAIPLADGLGNISDDPAFVDAAAGDYRLLDWSPCINMGTNDYAPMPFDLDGNPRIIGGTVDMGAYEFVPEPMAGLILGAALMLRLIRRRYTLP